MADIRTSKVSVDLIPGIASDIRTSKVGLQTIVEFAAEQRTSKVGLSVIPEPKSDIFTSKVLLQVIVMTSQIDAVVDQGGFDLEFTLPVLDAINGYMSVRTNIAVSEQANETECEIRFFEEVPDKIKIEVRHLASGNLYQSFTIPQTDGGDAKDTHKVRILWANKFCNIYLNDRWAHTFSFSYVMFPTSIVELNFFAHATWDGAAQIDDILLVELHDWREAIYVDTETTLFSALSAIIQDRPIEIYVTSEGKLKFAYNEERTQMMISPFSNDHTKTFTSNNNAGSEAIVYAADVELIEDPDYTATGGFVTRILRIPSLDAGAKRAAEVMLHRAKEREVLHSLKMRPDLRIECGDLLLIYYKDHHDDAEVSDVMIVEAVTQQAAEPVSNMLVRGRSYVA